MLKIGGPGLRRQGEQRGERERGVVGLKAARHAERGVLVEHGERTQEALDDADNDADVLTATRPQADYFEAVAGAAGEYQPLGQPLGRAERVAALLALAAQATVDNVSRWPAAYLLAAALLGALLASAALRAGRDTGFLLTTGRLDLFESWASSTTLRPAIWRVMWRISSLGAGFGAGVGMRASQLLGSR